MNKLLITATALFLGTTSLAMADAYSDAVIDAYVNGGFTGIEITDTGAQIRVEAYRDGIKYEVVYDRATQSEVSVQTRAARGDDRANDTSVEYRQSDSLDSYSGSDDDYGDDDHGGDDGDHGGDDDNDRDRTRSSSDDDDDRDRSTRDDNDDRDRSTRDDNDDRDGRDGGDDRDSNDDREDDHDDGDDHDSGDDDH